MRILADTCYKKGRYNESIELYQKCLERKKIILGENHPDTLELIFNLGLIYSALGKLNEAEAFFKDCYERRCIVLGRDHVDTLRCAEYVNKIYHLQGKL